MHILNILKYFTATIRVSIGRVGLSLSYYFFYPDPTYLKLVNISLIDPTKIGQYLLIIYIYIYI
jgi:hypothetical protein